MNIGNLIRVHSAALRALLVLTVITGLAYPVLVWAIAQLPGLKDKADGSIVTAGGKVVGSSLIGQLFTDAKGNALPQYFQSRPSNAGTGYDPMASGAGNLGPESIVDAGKPSLLTQVCTRSYAVAEAEGLDRTTGARPFCTADGVGAVLSVIGPRDATGNVTHPTKVVSVNQPCATTKEIAQVGSISANNEESIGKQIADAMQKVGEDKNLIAQLNATGCDAEILSPAQTVEKVRADAAKWGKVVREAKIRVD